MDGLVKWLGQQLDEDEAAAERTLPPELRVGRFRGKTIPRWRITKSGTGIIDEGGGTLRAQQIFPAEADHVIRHDPARVLLEVEAKRQLLALHVITVEKDDIPPFDSCTGERNPDEYSVTCAVCGWVSDDRSSACLTLRLLALPCADREGYRPEWAPSE